MTDARAEEGAQEFRFVSPGEGAYRVKLLGDDVANTASMLLAGMGDVTSVSVRPGSYLAIIEPIGSGDVLRQRVELQTGEGGAIRLFDAAFEGGQDSDPKPMARLSRVASGADIVTAEGVTVEVKTFRSTRPLRYEAVVEGSAWDGARAPSDAGRAFSLGLSVRYARDPDRTWRPSRLSATVSDRPSGDVALTLRRPPDWRLRPQWRLTVAVQDDPRWRMRIPLFAGGVQVVLTPASSPGGADILVSMAPRNAGRAALVSNLENMFLGSAREVVRSSLTAFRDFDGEDLIQHLVAVGEDPWTITAAGLLLAQTEELEPMSDSLRRFARRWAWLPDLAVLRAWLAVRQQNASRSRREAECLRLLDEISGRPYFAASQSLGQDLLTGLSLGGGDEKLRVKASLVRDRWSRLSSRQVPTGAFLGAEDARHAKGTKLSGRYYHTFASGSVKSSQISISSAETARSSKRTRIPALNRPLVLRNDPWKGRFGGASERDGFRLGARFSRGLDTWIEVQIFVKGPAKDREVVELFLHDSFSPDRVKLKFSDGAVCYDVLAWGGFTVGAWLATRGIELELDLAEMPEAPSVIRKY